MDHNDPMLCSWKCKPSRVAGLRYVPTTEPEYSDDEQRIFMLKNGALSLPMCIHSNRDGYVTLINNGPSVRQSHADMVRDAVSVNTKNVLEIGVNVYQKPLLSTTRAVLATKQSDCTYLGIDVNDKSGIDCEDEHVHTMIIDSSRRSEIRAKMIELGMLTIDLLLIDGDHSISATINDWCFTEFLSPHGVVIIHDTNVHTGPRAVFDAIDEMSFQKRLIGSEMKSGKFPDYGMGLARRLF